MGRAPCCDKAKVKKGPWSPEEDAKLKEYISKYGTGGNWIALPAKAGLKRCGKSCRLRWLNYLRPNIKHGEFTDDEDGIIFSLFSKIGSRWSIIAAHLPGRTDNDIKNYWNTKLKKKIMGISPSKRKNNTTSQQQMQLPWLPSSLHVRSSKSQGISNHSTRSNPFLTNIQSYPISSDFFSSFTTNTTPLQDNSTLLMLVGDQPSCSSSDGSFNQTITNVKEIEYNNYMGSTVGEEQMIMTSFNSLLNSDLSTVGEEQMIMTSFNSLLNSDLSTVATGEYQKLLFNSEPSHEIEKGNSGLLEDQVGFEDIVKLMFPNQSNRYDNLFLDDPSNDMIRSSNSCKNQESTMYYS